MATTIPTLTPTLPTPRYQSPARRDASPFKRTDSWRDSSGWRSKETSPDQSPTGKSDHSNPLDDNNWRAGCDPNGTAGKRAISPRKGEDYWRTARSPTRRSDRSVTTSSTPPRDQSPPKRDQSPCKYTGIARLMVTGIISGRVDLSRFPQFEAKEKEKEQRIAEKLQPTSPQKRVANPVTPDQDVSKDTTLAHAPSVVTATPILTADTNSTPASSITTTTDIDTKKATDTMADRDIDTSSATPETNTAVSKAPATNTASTPKQKKTKKVQPTQQSARKAAHTPAAATTVTPLKKQEYYAGPAFANSPAPSSLPIPKFFLRQEAAKASESPRSASASPAITANKPLSGLDMLFDADRKEKATKQQYTPTSQQLEHKPTEEKEYSKYENGKWIPLDDEEWRSHQSQQLKALVTGKPSTPTTQRAQPQRQQHMSAPPQFAIRTQRPPSTPAPSSDQEQQSDNYHYGNRRLSPMFEAVRPERHSNNPPGIMESIRPKHYRAPNSMEEQAAWDRYPQYSPNPTKTAAYQQSVPTKNYSVPIPEQLQQQMPEPTTPSKAQKEDAIRKMIGMK